MVEAIVFSLDVFAVCSSALHAGGVSSACAGSFCGLGLVLSTAPCVYTTPRRILLQICKLASHILPAPSFGEACDAVAVMLQ